MLNCTLCPAAKVIGNCRSLMLNPGHAVYSLETVTLVELVLIILADWVCVWPTVTVGNQRLQGEQVNVPELPLFLSDRPRSGVVCARLTQQLSKSAKHRR